MSVTTPPTLPAPASPILRLVAVEKRYGAARVLSTTDLDIDAARTTVLIGPSGCGKTTLLRLMMGLLRPDGGKVFFDETPVTPENVRGLRKRMGYVVQDGGLFPHLSAADNVCLMARHLGWEPERIDRRLADLADLARLPTAALVRYPAEMSGGQKQRVGLMRALMLDPELLLFDEPLAALDPLVRAELQDDLVTIFATLKKSVVLVTHDLAEAALFGHVIVLMKEGRIIQKGTVDDLVRRPVEAFVTRFVRAQRHFNSGAAADTGSGPHT